MGLLVDGLPMGYLLPTTFRLLMHAPEDESHHYLLASALIVLRYFALAISLTFPALYVAVAMYHQEMIPAKLLLSVIQAKQQVPFSVPTIILFMLIAFELLQEAGLRLPNSIGQTVSIIGALLVGQSAVDAKVVSPVAIIVVALTGIAGYTLPNRELSNAVPGCCGWCWCWRRRWRDCSVFWQCWGWSSGICARSTATAWRIWPRSWTANGRRSSARCCAGRSRTKNSVRRNTGSPNRRRQR